MDRRRCTAYDGSEILWLVLCFNMRVAMTKPLCKSGGEPERPHKIHEVPTVGSDSISLPFPKSSCLLARSRSRLPERTILGRKAGGAHIGYGGSASKRGSCDLLTDSIGARSAPSVSRRVGRWWSAREWALRWRVRLARHRTCAGSLQQLDVPFRFQGMWIGAGVDQTVERDAEAWLGQLREVAFRCPPAGARRRIADSWRLFSRCLSPMGMEPEMAIGMGLATSPDQGRWCNAFPDPGKEAYR